MRIPVRLPMQYKVVAFFTKVFISKKWHRDSQKGKLFFMSFTVICICAIPLTSTVIFISRLD